MKVVYLDQNKWIDLARAYYGLTPDVDIKAVLSFMRDTSAKQLVIFPLSAIHYMETARISNPNRRLRLGSVMWKLSGGHTITSYSKILCHELELALAKRFRQVSARSFKLLSKGVAHAFGEDNLSYRIPDALRSRLTQKRAQNVEAVIRSIIEKAVLTGEGPTWLTAFPFRVDTYRQNFMKHLENLHPKLSQLPAERLDDALHAASLVDILEPINEILARHGLSSNDLKSLGKKGLNSILQNLPTRKVDIHLHRQVLKNPTLKPKLSDLEDWAGLGPATVYCDVLVCEKHFADLLLRDGFQPQAQIITDIRDLPDTC